MAATETTRIPLGFQAPYFELPDTVSGAILSLSQLKGKHATIIMFICNHCPYVKHINRQLVELATDYMPKGIAFIAISSNDVVKYPDDAPELMKETALNEGYPFPYLYDETQEIAKAYHAACTPDFSIFDKDLKCVYRGQLDDSRPKSDIPVTGKDIRMVLEAILSGTPIPEKQFPSLGCNIKWK
ncbi:MAG: thioredoxin family protein [Chitinophagales bacterium]|nr:thioredoxin family protein [Chitinophagales bacterium]